MQFNVRSFLKIVIDFQNSLNRTIEIYAPGSHAEFTFVLLKREISSPNLFVICEREGTRGTTKPFQTDCVCIM